MREVELVAAVLNAKKLGSGTEPQSFGEAGGRPTCGQRKRSGDGDRDGAGPPKSYGRDGLLCGRESRGYVYDGSNAADTCVSWVDSESDPALAEPAAETVFPAGSRI